MAKLKAPLLSFGAHGTIGKDLTFSSGKQGHIAKKIPTHPDAYKLGQLFQRLLYRDGCYYWHTLNSGQKAAYETAASGKNLTAFNAFMRVYLQTPLDQLARFQFQESQGSTVFDLAGNNHDLTFSGNTWVNDLFRFAANSDGVDDVMTSDPSADFLTDAGTVFILLNPLGVGNGKRIFHGRETSSNEIFIFITGSLFRVRFAINSPAGFYGITSDSPIDLYEPHVIACRYGIGGMSTVIDGVVQSVTDPSEAVPDASSLFICLGGLSGTPSVSLAANFGYLVWYNRQLSDEQIKDQTERILLWLANS